MDSAQCGTAHWNILLKDVEPNSAFISTAKCGTAN